MQRIHHNAALKYLTTHEFIDLCPCKLYPYGPFRPSIRVFREQFDERVAHCDGDIKKAWKQLCTEFKFYNCTLNETGYGIAFYKGE